MRRFIITSSLIGSLIIFLLTLNVPDSLVMFILFGMIPGTSTVVSAGQMQSLWLVSAFLVVGISIGPWLYKRISDKLPTHLLRAAQ
jgi:ABC-type glycerol-3-phosphate transport system permease component